MTRPAGLGELLRRDEDIADRPAARRALKDAVLAFFRAIATRDMERLGAILTEDAVYEMPFSESGSTEPGRFRHVAGRQNVVEAWSNTSGIGIKVAAPEAVEVTVTADGSRLFIEQRGNMVMPDGKAYRNRYVFRFDARDGLISHVKEYINPVISAYAFGRPLANGVRIDSLD